MYVCIPAGPAKAWFEVVGGICENYGIVKWGKARNGNGIQGILDETLSPWSIVITKMCWDMFIARICSMLL